MYSTTGIDASNFVSTFNTSFFFITGVSLFLLTGLTIVMLYFVFRYNRKKNKVAVQNEGNLLLEIIWTVIPVLLALAMFYYGWAGWRPMNRPPKEGINITSTARMWSFSFQYENGRVSPDLIIPVDTAVKIKLVSLDVLHSLSIPAFRVKSDMVPGRDKIMWFVPQRTGEYDLYCAEYCGLRHSYMNAKVIVLSNEEFNSWYADTSIVIKPEEGSAPGSEGFAIMNAQGCNACHSSDGTKIVGPSYLNLFGKQKTVIMDGKEIQIIADEEYIKRALLKPDSEIVKGYPKGIMVSYQGILSDDDILKITEYLKTISD
jgi:cytochrome c oxidase subunit 2